MRNKALSTALKQLKAKFTHGSNENDGERKDLSNETFDAVDEIACSHDCQLKIAEWSKTFAALKEKLTARRTAL